MNRMFQTLVIVGALVGVLDAGKASAQVVTPMTFTTPFAFTVNHKTMPAGTYELRQAGTDPSVLELTAVHGTRGMFFETEGVENRADDPAPRTEVVFLHYGDQYLLKDIWVAGEATGAEAPGRLSEARAAANAGAQAEVRVAAFFLAHSARAHS